MTAPERIDPVDWGTIERLEDALSDLMGGVMIDPHRQSDSRFNGDQARQRHWAALAEDMRRPCLEDTVK